MCERHSGHCHRSSQDGIAWSILWNCLALPTGTLDDFNALEVDEKLQRVVDYLRNEYYYCFWCKFTYPDQAMEGCPGDTEEDHD